MTTHYHELLSTGLEDAVDVKHLSVYYDDAKRVLVYDRIVKEGCGNKSYGLEVCKSMHFPREFIELAFSTRNECFGIKEKTSRYNKNKVIGLCEECGENQAVDTHHLVEQNEMTDTNRHMIHHSGNLMALCKECHQKMHQTSNEIVTNKKKESTKKEPTKKEPTKKKKTNDGYIYV